MKYNDFTKELVKQAVSADEGYFQYVYLIARRLPKHLHEQLTQLIYGPIWDGDIICKAYRSELFEYGLAVRVCCKGQDGYTGATYLAYSVMKAVEEIKTGKVA